MTGNKSATGFYPLPIAAIYPETDTAVCITFTIPNQLQDIFRFQHGQFLTLRADIDGEDIRRSYSICSAVDEGCLQVGIKRVRGGKFSNYANDYFQVGDLLDVMPPQGVFTSSVQAARRKSYLCIAAGSGITPVLSIIKTLLHQEPYCRMVLIYGNRRTSSVMFKETLGFIKNRYMNRFSWINVMNQEDQGSDVLNGRIDNDKGTALHKNKLINILTTDEVFICGPESMISEVSRGFRSLGFDDSRIHYELFSNSAEDSETLLEKAKERIETYGEKKTSAVTLVADGRSHNFELATVGENILDAGLHHGIELPYACKAGVCSTCKAKLISGQVDMDLHHGLEESEMKAGYVLTCQAHPISDQVVVDFDQR